MHIEKGHIKLSKKTEVWAAGYHISNAIYDMVSQFKALDRHSYPSSLNGLEEWDEILDKILFAFHDHEEHEPDLATYGVEFVFGPEECLADGSTRRKMERLDPQNRYDEYQQDVTDYWAKVAEGEQLFALYVRDLWY